MLRQALVLAAGRGRPVADPALPNCLAQVGGRPLYQRTIETLARLGMKRIAFTVGFGGALVRQHIEATWPGKPAVEIVFFDNPAFEKPNGLSVQVARAFLTEPTLIMMSDQIAAPALVERFVQRTPPVGTTVLGIDRELSRVFDIDDATKVALVPAGVHDRGRPRVATIGKQLTVYEAVSTSLIAASPTLLECLDALPEPSLTEGLGEAARRGLCEALDVTGEVWQDVDSAEMRGHADWLLRAYGDELARPHVVGAAVSGATDTLALVDRLIHEKDAPRYTLFNPGPVMTSARVKAALVHHDVCHRDDEYTGVVRRLEDKLRPIFGATPAHDVLLLTGSGTAAMEVAVASTLPAGKKLLTISNGAFGERLGDIADVHGLPHVRLRLPWGELVDPAAVEAAFAREPDIGAVAMIRHETSVGLLNPVAAVGKLCRARGALLVCDAVSALGAEELDVEADGIDVCFASSNKCLHAVAGVAFLCVSPRVWPLIDKTAPRSYYLDLRRYRRAKLELGQTPFTPAVSTFFALETALDELEEAGGVPARRALYQRHNFRIRRVLTSLGYQSFTNTGRESITISMFKVPPFVDANRLYDGAKSRGFVIYRAKGALAADHIQIANMGALEDRDVDALLAALTELTAEAERAAGSSPSARSTM